MFYGQHKEDKLLHEFFQKDEGFFVDVGASDGVKFSNTKFFEDLGWDGICFEPNPRLYKELKENRKCHLYDYAVGKENGEVTFYANQHGVVSTIDEKLLPYFKKKIKKAGRKAEWKEVIVPIVRLDSILEEQEIDFISIDIEGRELDVLKGMDIKTNRPRIAIIETISLGYNHRDSVEFLEKHGYTTAFQLGANAICCRDKKDADKLKWTKKKLGL